MTAELKKYDESRKFSYKELKDGTPEGVDPSSKEVCGVDVYAWVV